VLIDIVGTRDGEPSTASPPTTTSTRSGSGSSCPSSTSTSRRLGRRHPRVRRRPTPTTTRSATGLRLHGQGGQGEGPARPRPTSGSPRRPSSPPSTSCAPTCATRITRSARPRPRWPAREGGEALAELVDLELPEALVSPRCKPPPGPGHAPAGPGHPARAVPGHDRQTQEELVDELRETPLPPRPSKVDLALRAVAEAEGIEVTDDELEAELASVAERVGEARRRSGSSSSGTDQIPAVRSDIAKRKALEWLLERVEVVDEDGQPIDRASSTRPPTPTTTTRRHHDRRSDDEPRAARPSDEQ
jgi:hypothetical protein